jgi:hypothetical protein
MQRHDLRTVRSSQSSRKPKLARWHPCSATRFVDLHWIIGERVERSRRGQALRRKEVAPFRILWPTSHFAKEPDAH